MSQPPPYTPTTDFSQEEANNVGGRSTVRTAMLDAELANIATTIAAVRANLVLIQRDDGKLADGLVELYNFSATALAAMGGGAAETVADNIADITTVADNIADLILVATDIAKVVIVADGIGDVVIVANAIASVNILAPIAADITAAALIAADITANAANGANITIAAGAATAIGTVATNIGDVGTVAGGMASVNIVADNITKVDLAVAISRIKPDTAAGLAAYASGEYFSVPSGDADESVIIYKNNAGVAEEVTRLPSTALLTAFSLDSGRTVVAGDASASYRMADADNRIAVQIDGAGDPTHSQNYFRAGLQRAGLDWTQQAVRAMEHHGVTFPSLDYWGVRIVGQSNASAGNATPALSTTQPFSNLRLSGTSLIPLVETTWESCATVAASHASQARLNALPPWATFPQQWVFINDGASGTVLSGIDQGSSVYNTGLTRVTSAKNAATAAGKSYAERAMVLIHGETDNINDMARATYKAGIIQFKDDWNTDASALTGQTSRIPMFIAQMGASSSNDGTTGGHFNTIHAMLDAAEDDDEMFVVFAGYFATFGNDGLHYSNYGQATLGEYVGKALHRYFVEGRDPNIVRPTGHTLLSARALEITFSVPVPPLRFDLDRVWVAPNYGFRILDAASAEITISNIYISDFDKVVIETSADMSAGCTYEYASQLPANSAGGGPFRGGRGNLFDSDQTLSYSTNEDGERYTLPAMCAAFKKTIA